MNRLSIYLLAVAVSAAASLSSRAQKPAIFYIGILSPAGSPSITLFEAFREGLRDRGYVDGHNITIEYRLAAATSPDCPL
jgi:putative ABC transport system substrate-binding protein